MNSLKLAAALGLGALLAGCGGSGSEATGEATEAAAAPSETATPVVAAATAPASFAICSACHSVNAGENGIGPSLVGIYGTKAGEVQGFEFSDELIKSGLTWDDATLDKWLTNPQALVPGTKMSFGGIQDAAQRKELVEYLKTLK